MSVMSGRAMHSVHSLRRVFRRLRLSKGATVSLVTLSLLAAALTVLGTAAPAEAAGLQNTSLITWNMQGEGDGGAGKWQTVYDYARNADIVMLQEAGPQGPSSGTAQNPIVTPEGYTVQHSELRLRGQRTTVRHQVYFLQTDGNNGRNAGGRVNIAVITRAVPDEVRVVGNLVTAGRAALGVRFGNYWYFSVHALSSGGNDGAALADTIDNAVTSWGAQYEWTIGGDFNREPEDLTGQDALPPGTYVYGSDEPTHIYGDTPRELDYFLTNERATSNIPVIRAPGASSDHVAVWLNGLAAGAEAPDLRVMATGDGLNGTDGPVDAHGYQEYAMDSVADFYRNALSGGGLAPKISLVGTPSPAGQEIAAISKRTEADVSADQPNIVMLQAGTYDMVDGDSSGASQRLSDLIDQIQTDDPNAVVLLATLGPATNPAVQTRIDDFNQEILSLYHNLQNAGRHVALADMSTLTTAYLSADGITPSAPGFVLMSRAFDEALRAAFINGWVQSPGSAGQTGPFGQQIAMAAYSNPTGDPAAWNRLIDADSTKASVLVANVLNGPGSTKDDAWADVINRAHASGKKVLGYVDTGYLGQADGRTTRLGSTQTQDWVAQMEQDVSAWYSLYGSSIDGIFFDDGYNVCGTDDQFSDTYADVNQYTKRYHPGAMTVLNPGTVVPQCYENSADTLLTYEGSYAGYFGNEANAALNYQPLGWTPSDPSKIWNIISNPPAAGITAVAQAAQSRDVGYVEITDDVQPNPYDQQPDDAYWSAEQNAVAGGTPRVANATPYTSNGDPAPAAPGLELRSSDYSSASISWSLGAGAARYIVRANGVVVADLPTPMTSTTIGGLVPNGTSYTLTVTAQNSDGLTSPASNGVTFQTLSLPGGKTVTNVKLVSSTPNFTTYSADFLVPYSFRRVFVSGDTTSGAAPCWQMANPDNGDPECMSYVVENTTLLTYAGTGTDWTWSPLQYLPPTVDKYTYTWTIPIGYTSTDFDPYTFAIQGEGYGPLTTIFVDP